MARPKTQLNRKTEILDAAQRLFEKKGFEKTTIQEIADYIGISKGSVYLEFKNKDEISLAIVERHSLASIKKFEENINNSNPPYLNILENLLMKHPLEVYDIAVFNMQPYAALIHTSYQFKIKLKHLIQKWHNLVGCLLSKAAENGEIQKYQDYEVLAHLLQVSFQGFFPPYDLKYSTSYRTDLTKEEIRSLLKKDISVVLKIILTGLKTVQYEEDS